MKDNRDKHFYISMTKSILRLGGCYGLFLTEDKLLMGVAIVFAIAEILGIAEEF